MVYIHTYIENRVNIKNEIAMERVRERAINDFLNKIDLNQIKYLKKKIETVDAYFSSAVVKVSILIPVVINFSRERIEYDAILYVVL